MNIHWHSVLTFDYIYNQIWIRINNCSFKKKSTLNDKKSKGTIKNFLPWDSNTRPPAQKPGTLSI